MNFRPRPVSILVLLVAAALALAACGRKGDLDPPPAAAVPTDGVRPGNVGTDETPPPPPRRGLPIDWLLN